MLASKAGGIQGEGVGGGGRGKEKVRAACVETCAMLPFEAPNRRSLRFAQFGALLSPNPSKTSDGHLRASDWVGLAPAHKEQSAAGKPLPVFSPQMLGGNHVHFVIGNHQQR